MNSIPTTLQPDLRVSFLRDSTGIEMAYPQAKGIPSWIPAEVLDEASQFGMVAHVMVNRLPAGVTVPIHTDAPGDVTRYHLPLVTNPEAFWWDEVNGEVHMREGFWWGPVPYSIPHRVSNLGASARVHLIVDVKESSDA